MQFPVVIGLRRSRISDVVILILAILGTLSIFYFSRTLLIQSGMLFVTWFFAFLAWINLAPFFPAIRLERNGHIFATSKEGVGFSQVTMQPYSLVHSWLTIVRLKTELGHIRTLVITGDSITNTEFRYLRMFLRWKAEFNAPGDDV